MVEVIPQHIYRYEDGKDAYKSGEWEGSRPCHFVGSKMIIKPIEKPIDYTFKIGHNKHFPARYSEEAKFKPEKKLIILPPKSEKRNPLRKSLEPKYTDKIELKRNILNHPPEQFNLDFIAPLFPAKKKFKIVPNREEYTIEKILKGKKRITNIEQLRNNFDEFSPGDNIYKEVSHSPGFYKLEGLIPGSTNTINYKKNFPIGTDNFFNSLDLKVKILNDDKKWENKCLRESLDKDTNYVKMLIDWDENVLGLPKKEKKNN